MDVPLGNVITQLLAPVTSVVPDGSTPLTYVPIVVDEVVVILIIYGPVTFPDPPDTVLHCVL